MLFFDLLHRIRDTFKKLFSGGGYKSGRNRTCKEYKEFAKAWGIFHSIASAADYKITEIRKIYQENLMFFFEYLTYMQDKSLADEFQDKYMDKLRKQKAL